MRALLKLAILFMQITWSSKLTDELALRTGPLRAAWEARGPGLLKGIATCVGPDFLADSATVVPVLPGSRSGSRIDRAQSEVHIEAVLANPYPQLPEVVRLGWLLSQLDGPASTTADDAGVWPLALVPIVLTAAEDVELASCRHETTALALCAWMQVDSAPAERAAGELLGWWESVCDYATLSDAVDGLEQRSSLLREDAS